MTVKQVLIISLPCNQKPGLILISDAERGFGQFWPSFASLCGGGAKGAILHSAVSRLPLGAAYTVRCRSQKLFNSAVLTFPPGWRGKAANSKRARYPTLYSIPDMTEHVEYGLLNSLNLNLNLPDSPLICSLRPKKNR